MKTLLTWLLLCLTVTSAAWAGEGPLTTATVVAGPFDVHRRYRSMEGPYISFSARVGDLLAQHKTVLPESMVTFVEGGNAPSMMGGPARPVAAAKANQPRTLYWLKGFKLEVLDEHDRVMPNTEFLCHYNLDVDPDFRRQAFPHARIATNTRILTLTQGQSALMFPDGYGVPVASDETWNMVFQVANRTTDQHRRVKHRITMYFVKDSDLVYPITALTWYTPYVRVIYDSKSADAARLEKQKCPSCLGYQMGVNAPNNTAQGTLTDAYGQRLTGHWVVPPGKHSWTTTLTETFDGDFGVQSAVIHAVWVHVHPLCTALGLYRLDGKKRVPIFHCASQSTTTQGLQIQHIDYLSSKGGIAAPKGRYELQVDYNNTTGKPQDSMAVAGIFIEDPTFARPDWVAKPGYSCMPKH